MENDWISIVYVSTDLWNMIQPMSPIRGVESNLWSDRDIRGVFAESPLPEINLVVGTTTFSSPEIGENDYQ